MYDPDFDRTTVRSRNLPDRLATIARQAIARHATALPTPATDVGAASAHTARCRITLVGRSVYLSTYDTYAPGSWVESVLTTGFAALDRFPGDDKGRTPQAPMPDNTRLYPGHRFASRADAVYAARKLMHMHRTRGDSPMTVYTDT